MSHEANTLNAIVMDRIAELLRYRRWFRTHSWADWPTLRQEYDVELRALLRLARQARGLSRPASPDGDHHVYPAGVGR